MLFWIGKSYSMDIFCIFNEVNSTLKRDAAQTLVFAILPQSKRNSGFGASDELSSEEEEGVQPVDVSPSGPWLPSAPPSSVRSRNSSSKAAVRPQVKLLVPAQFCSLEKSIHNKKNNFSQEEKY